MNPMKRTLTILAASLALLVLANCTASTPQTRIDRNYSLYESLPPKHQELVHQGRITKGMSKSAVFLALGDPSRKTEGYRDNDHFERWDYTRLEPRYYNTFYTSFGFGTYGHRHSDYYGYGFAPTVEYVPYRSITVLFRSGVVDSWERLSGGGY
jgi:outer membrane protein assembly factor BamE (lipoprotein component of BamABCDE complex)